MQTINRATLATVELKTIVLFNHNPAYVAQTRSWFSSWTEFLPRSQTLVHIRLFVSCIPHYVASFRCSLKLLHCTNNMFKFIWFTCFPSSLRNNKKKCIKQLHFPFLVYDVLHVLHFMLTQNYAAVFTCLHTQHILTNRKMLKLTCIYNM